MRHRVREYGRSCNPVKNIVKLIFLIGLIALSAEYFCSDDDDAFLECIGSHFFDLEDILRGVK